MARKTARKKKINMKAIALIIGAVIVLGAAALMLSAPAAPKEDYSSLAACLSEKNVKMYGSITCSVCKKQRDYFGAAFKFIEEIECNARAPNSQVDRCLAMKIEKTPTWILEQNGLEFKRLEGFQSAEVLSEFSGCPPAKTQ